jgi:hypothetical protein
VALVALAAGVLAGCSDDGGAVETPDERTIAVYTRVLKWVLAEHVPVRPAEEEDLPVIYVVGGSGVEIGTDVQAAVVKNLLDEATVRFADEREEAIDDSLEQLPVRDEGVLVVLPPVPEEGRSVDMPVEVYVDEADDTTWELNVARLGSVWSVRSAAQVS